MIPKIIHYCWFGKAELSSLEKKCIASWKKHCPDFQIKLWNEENFDINYCEFTAEAYQQGKYAFVSDVARLYALQKEGGVYLDTDMLLLKDFPEYLMKTTMFLGKENPDSLSAGVIGSLPELKILCELLNFYNNQKFGTNPVIIPSVLNKILSNRIIQKEGMLNNVSILSEESFYPLPYDKRCDDWRIHVKENSIGIHLWEGSWIDYPAVELLKMKKYKRALRKIFSDLSSKENQTILYVKKIIRTLIFK